MFGSPEKAVLSDLKKTTSLLDKKERTLSEHEKALNVLDSRIRQRERELKAYADKIVGQEAEVQRKQKALLERELRVEKAEAGKAGLLKERATLEQDAQKLSLKVLEKQEEVDAIEKRKAAQLDALEKRKRERILDMEKAIAAKRKELVGCQDDIDRKFTAFKAEKEGLLRELQDASARRLAGTEAQKNALIAAKQKELVGLQDQLDKRLAAFKAAKADALDAMESAFHARMARQEENKKKEMQDIQAVIDGKRKELAGVQKGIDGTMAAFKREKAAVADEMVKAAERRVAALLASKREDIDGLNAAVRSLRKEQDEVLAVTRKELARLKNEKEGMLIEFKRQKEASAKAMLAEKEREMDNLNALLAMRAKGLEDRIKEFRRKKEEALAEFAAKKGKMMEDAERAVAAKRKELASVQYEVANQLSKLKAAQAEVAKELKEQEKLKADIIKAQQVTEQRLDVLTQKEKELEDLADEYGAKKRQLGEETAQLRKSMEADAAAKKKQLDARERDIAKKELTLIKHSDEMEGLRDQLRQEKEELATLVAGKKAELVDTGKAWEENIDRLQLLAKDIRGERDRTESIVKKDLVAITDKEKKITDSVQDLEEDNRRLKKEENAIVRRVHDLEKAEAEFARMKTMFDRKVEEFGVRERDIKEREDLVVRGMRDIDAARGKVDAAWEKVRTVKEHKASIEALSRARKELEDTVTRLSKRAIVLEHKQPLATERKEAPAKPVAEKRPVVKEEGKAVHREPHELIAEARQAFDAGDMKNAQHALARAEGAVRKLKAGDEKRDLSYDVWDLKTSIKLALVQ